MKQLHDLDVNGRDGLRLFLSADNSVLMPWEEVGAVLETAGEIIAYDPETERVIWEQEYDFRICPVTGEVTEKTIRKSQPIREFVRDMQVSEIEKTFLTCLTPAAV